MQFKLGGPFKLCPQADKNGIFGTQRSCQAKLTKI